VGRPEDNASSQTSHWAQTDENVRLMLAFQKGEQDAFRLLVERNQAKVYSIICRLVTDAALAEDLTQEVFLRVFRTVKRYQPMAKFTTWLYRIASNVALNAIRSQRKMRMITLDLPESPDGDTWQRDVHDTGQPGPRAQLDAQELQAKLLEAIAELPENQRMALTLKQYEHLSYQDIADIMGCSTMAIKSLLSRARCNLRDALVRYYGKDFARNLPNP
jgi:RNA polymerase sigma-70 factor (ECF subfamily)